MSDAFTQRHPQATGTVLATGASLWAACFLIFWKLAEGTGPRGALVFALLLSAAVISSAVTLVVRRAIIGRPDRRSLGIIGILALCTVVGNFASLTGLATCNPAIASIVFQAQVFMIAVLERILIRYPISPVMMLGAVLAVGGFGIMQRGSGIDADAADPLGMAWILLAAATFAVMLVVTRRVAAHIDMLMINSLRLWLAVAVLALWPGLLADVAELGREAWGLAAAAGLCGLVLSRLLLMYTVRFIPATTAKLVTLTTPLFALWLSWWWLAAIPGWRDLAGGAVILIGVALPVWWTWRRERRRAAVDDADAVKAVIS